jgi:undecaprenyl-diphosphatase
MTADIILGLIENPMQILRFENNLHDLNLCIFHFINGFAGNHVLDIIVSKARDNAFLHNVILTAPYVTLWFRKSDQKSRADLLLGLLAGLVAVLIARVLAHILPFETRPMFDASSGFQALTVPGPCAEGWSAFPSDNAAFTLALAAGLYSVNRAVSVTMAVLVAILYGVFRVYSGFHFPADVIAGWMIGIASVAAVRKLDSALKIFDRLSVPKEMVPYLYGGSFLLLTEYASMFHTVRALARVTPVISSLLHLGS